MRIASRKPYGRLLPVLDVEGGGSELLIRTAAQSPLSLYRDIRTLDQDACTTYDLHSAYIDISGRLIRTLLTVVCDQFRHQYYQNKGELVMLAINIYIKIINIPLALGLLISCRE